jgi:hypothetical protein
MRNSGATVHADSVMCQEGRKANKTNENWSVRIGQGEIAKITAEHLFPCRIGVGLNQPPATNKSFSTSNFHEPRNHPN